MSSGYFSLPRDLYKMPAWKNAKLKHRAFFNELAARVVWKEQKYDLEGDVITLKPGQYCSSLRRMVEDFNPEGLKGKACGDAFTKNDIEGAIQYFICHGLIRQEIRQRKRSLIRQRSSNLIRQQINVLTICLSGICEELDNVNQTAKISDNQTAKKLGNQTLNQTQKKKEEKKKEDHHPYPSSSKPGLTDDFSFDLEKEEIPASPSTPSPTAPTQHNTNYHPQPPVEVIPGIFMSQKELDQCIAIKGSLESVQHAVEYINRSPGRKHKIQDWPNALSTWQIKNDIKPRLQENEEMAKRLEKLHENSPTWRCRVYSDSKRDQKGILFYANVGSVDPIFIPFIDTEFKEKVTKILRSKKMQQGRISNP